MTIGADGCKSGWVAAIQQQGMIQLKIFPDIETLWQSHGGDCELLLIDMPIGLTDKGTEGRACDRLARRMLSPRRHSSIFTPPCRPALYAPQGQESAINFEHTGKKLSRQSINIMPKMREVDQWICRLPGKDHRRIFESHPEIIFTALNGGVPLFHNKKSKAGQLERIQLLESYRTGITKILEKELARIPRKEALPDDLIDALALGIAADIATRTPPCRRSLPPSAPLDKKGLKMEIFFVQP